MNKAINISNNFNTNGLYRMPWTMSDNSSTWLEITRDCDITCEYCIQGHDKSSHKSLIQVEFEISELMRLRKCDSMIIAGGEPLTHPDVVEIIKLVAQEHVKPIIITNGVQLNNDLLLKLKDAGLKGAILHIDSGQHRPDWLNKTELELNELRQHFVNMFKAQKGLICSFITTVTPHSLKQVPDIIHWMRNNGGDVAQNIFIPVRGLHSNDPWKYYVNGEEIKIETTDYNQKEQYMTLYAKDIYQQVKKELPEFKFSSFLGGTEQSDAPKWLFGFYFQTKKYFLGCLGQKSMELSQAMCHTFFGKYLSFLKPWNYRWGKLLFPLAIIDQKVRKLLWKYIKIVLKSPVSLFRTVTIQSIIIMQPFDILENGECDMCDSCPNKTYFKGRLVSECRMEEYLKYGRLMNYVPDNNQNIEDNKITKIER